VLVSFISRTKAYAHVHFIWLFPISYENTLAL